MRPLLHRRAARPSARPPACRVRHQGACARASCLRRVGGADARPGAGNAVERPDRRCEEQASNGYARSGDQVVGTIRGNVMPSAGRRQKAPAAAARREALAHRPPRSAEPAAVIRRPRPSPAALLKRTAASTAHRSWARRWQRRRGLWDCFALALRAVGTWSRASRRRCVHGPSSTPSAPRSS